LGKEPATPAGLFIPDDFELSAAAYPVNNGFVPAIACSKVNEDEYAFVLQRASRPLDSLDAAEEADADLDSAENEEGDLPADWSKYLISIGYTPISGPLRHFLHLEELREEEDLAAQSDLLLKEVESHIRDDRPREARQTFVRLRRAGHARIDAIEMMAHALLHEKTRAEQEESKIDIQRYAAALLRLPELECEQEAVHDRNNS
jgi:hypothetical protein